MQRLATAGFEEAYDQFRTLRRQYALHYFHPMIEKFRIGNSEFTANASEAEIARAKNQPADACAHQSARAHDAWFQSGIKRTAFDAVVSQGLRGLPQGDDFGMRGGIVILDWPVPASADDLAIQNHDRAHRVATYKRKNSSRRTAGSRLAGIKISSARKTETRRIHQI